MSQQAGVALHKNNATSAALLLGSLGVVYGDIGTSPLYAVKECFHGLHAISLTYTNIMGVMSLIFWSMTMVITFKYVSFIMQADNHGEGGIYALLALFLGKGSKSVSQKTVSSLIFLAIIGAALIYGDGVITPAISVLSALEGLNVATAAADNYVLPLSCIVLFFIFALQQKGTGKIGRIFGPVMVVWFFSIAILGMMQVIKQPEILKAVMPGYAIDFFLENKLHGMTVLGSVVLCITGGEALYADMGHFGAFSIKITWIFLVAPSLLLNYFGQCALLLENSLAAQNPFYGLTPDFFLYPMVVLATLATIIASQAMISGVYSLTQQAIQLGFCPRLQIVHTSRDTQGQIYMPWVNGVMMVICIGVALAFRESSRLAAAYGIAVTATMAITTILYYYVAHHNWKWSAWKATGLCGIFLIFDAAYLGANLLKFFDGGWFTISVAAIIAILIMTWRDGRAFLAKRFKESHVPMDIFLKDMKLCKLMRTPGTAVFMTLSPSGAPVTMLHHIKHTNAIHKRVVLISILSTDTPYVSRNERVTLTDLGQGFYRILARYGFMQTPNVPEILEHASAKGLEIDHYSTSFYLGKETIVIGRESRMADWRKKLFIFLSRNAWNVATFFRIPPERVIELGVYIEI